MRPVIVGVGDMKTSADPDSVLVTYGLGSCIAVMLADPRARVAGMLHFMLPESSLDREKARAQPAMFADTGLALLFDEMAARGADRRRSTLWVAGGAQMMDEAGVFAIGKRNYTALRKILWKAGLLIHAEEVGGMVSRTVRLEVGPGRCWLHPAGEPPREMAVGRPRPAALPAAPPASPGARQEGFL